MQIKIDSEFKALIPPLKADEYAQLEANILADGCRDALVVWAGVLIDGHNRYEICTKHGIEFDTVEMEFADRESVMDWMDANQLGRRNLTPDQFTLLLGRMYNRQKKAQGAPQGNYNAAKQMAQNEQVVSTADKLASEYGVSRETVKRAGKVAEMFAALPEEKREAVFAGEKRLTEIKREIKEEKKEDRREENRAKVAVADSPEKIAESGAKFSTIVIDPPWDWGDEGDQDQLGRARPDYATMSIDKLLDLPVGALADEDCHIYLWITNRSLPKGFALLEKWGFRYITCLTWVKPHFGMGNYYRGSSEQVLFGVKGSQMLKRKDVGTVFYAPRGAGGHSSKPVEFLELVESCSHSPYLEMFSRCDRKGWFAWGEGNE